MPLPSRLLAALLVTLALLPGVSEAQGVSLAVQPLAPFAPIHRWAPLKVELTNTGGATEVEVLLVEQTYGRFAPTEYRLPVSLPGPGRRRYWMYVRPHPWVTGGRFTTRLIQNGRQIQSGVTTLRALDPFDRLILVIDPEPGVLGALADLPLGRANTGYGPAGGATPRVQAGHVTPADAPDRWAGYDGASLVVLGSVTEEALSARQRAALLEWVQMGGTVVVNGGDETRQRSRFYRELAAPGLGLVRVLPYDFARAPYRGSPGTVEQIRLALAEAREVRARAQNLSDAAATPNEPSYGRSTLGEACYAIGEMDAPPMGTIALFLGAYLVCLVPVNYAILKRRDRKEWAWVTTPAIVLLFSTLAYGIGFGIKGGRVFLSRVGVIEATAGAPVGAGHSYVGLFSPRKTRYDLAISEPRGLLSEWQPHSSDDQGRALTVHQEERWSATGAELDMWSMRVFSVEHPVDLGEGIVARWDRPPMPESLAGSITNRTPYDLEGCWLIVGGRAFSLGDLARGASVDPARLVAGSSMNFTHDLLPSSLKGAGPVPRLQRAVLESLGQGVVGGAPRLIGWLRRPPFDVTVDGRPTRETTAHLVAVKLQ